MRRTARRLDIERKESIVEVASAADVVSVHVALKPETTGMIGSEFFDAMRPGSFFVNTSRADIVDQAALARAVSERGLRAGLDVFAGEGSKFVHAHWDGTAETEKAIKDETKVTIRCLPLAGDGPPSEPGKCIKTGKPSARRVLFAKAY